MRGAGSLMGGGREEPPDAMTKAMDCWKYGECKVFGSICQEFWVFVKENVQILGFY